MTRKHKVLALVLLGSIVGLGMAAAALDETIASTTLAEVPINPASIGRDRSGQASEAMATPLGHIPPIPKQATNRSTSSWSNVCAK